MKLMCNDNKTHQYKKLYPPPHGVGLGPLGPASRSEYDLVRQYATQDNAPKVPAKLVRAYYISLMPRSPATGF